MTVDLQAAEPGARYIVQREVPLVRGFELLATAQGGVDSLRELILSLAVRGLLVRQSADDAPGSAVVRAVRQTKVTVSDARMTKRDERLASIADDELPYGTPTGWAWVRLGELLTKFGAGSTPLGGREVYTTAGVKFLRSQNVWNHGLALGGVAFIPAAVHEKMGGTKVFAGDLLFNITGASIGRCALVPESFDEGNVSQHVTILRTALPSIRPFLHLVLISAHVQQTVRDVQVGVSREGLSIAKLGQFVIPLPPLAEQHRIVARVEELMKLCDALEQSGRLADEQHARLTSTLFDALAASESAHVLAENWQRIAEHFDLLLDRPEAIDALEQAILQLAASGRLVPQENEAGQGLKPHQLMLPEGFLFEVPSGWRWATMGQLCALVTSGSRSWKDYYAKEGSTFIRSQDIKADRLEFDNRAFVKLPRTTEGVRTQVQLLDMLITITGANVGKAAVLSEPLEDAYVSQHVALARLHEPRMVDFIHLWLVNTHGGRKLLLASSYGAKPGLNLKNIKDLLVPLPPLAEQHRIVARVEELRRLCAQLRERLAEARRTQSQLAEALVAEVG